MTSLSKSMPHCQYFDPKGVNFMTPMSKKKQCGQDYDKDVMIAGFPLLTELNLSVFLPSYVKNSRSYLKKK